MSNKLCEILYMYLNIKLDKKTENIFIQKRDEVGLKSNSEFLRYILNVYLLKDKVNGKD